MSFLYAGMTDTDESPGPVGIQETRTDDVRVVDAFADRREREDDRDATRDRNDARGQDPDTLGALLQCFGLWGLGDNRSFSRGDMQKIDTVARVRALTPELRRFYTPCKARVYLDREPSDRGCVTVLKQVLRKHGRTLMSRERNVQGHKTIFYQVIDPVDIHKLSSMTKRAEALEWVSF